MRKNREIERLRALAVIMVIFVHATFLHPVLPWYLRSSFTGVDLFFVISGYVVTLSLLRSLPVGLSELPLFERIESALPALKVFYLKRIFRILPAAITWAFIYLGLAFYYGERASYLFGTPSHLLREIGFFLSGCYNYIKYPEMKVYYLGHYWSLTVEEHFYFILPLLLILFARRGNRLLVVLGGVLLVAFGLRYIPAPMRFDEVAWLTQASHRRFDQLLMGGALALILGRKGREKMIEHNVYSLNISERFFISWILPGVFLFLLWVMPTIFPYPFNNFMGQTIYGLFALGLVFLATYEKGFIGNAPVLGKMLEYIGSRSYSIYLAHVAFISLNIQWGNDLIPWFGEATLNLPSILWLRFLLILIVSILAAEITYRLIERPFIRYGSKFYS